MSDETPDGDEDEREVPSFQERLEEARANEGEGMDDPFASGGGNPFAQMMGGMMGGGLGGDLRGEQRETAVARELTQLREDIQDLTAEVARVADALEDE